MEGSAREKLLEGMSLLSDKPADSHLFFDFKTHAKRVADLLKSDKTPTPFTVAIHGEWGSGKTTLLNLIEKSVGNSMQVIRFDAWEHERSDIIASLLKRIEEKLCAQKVDTKALLIQIASFATDAFLRKTANMTQAEAKNHFNFLYRAPTSVKATLEKLTADHKIVIFIDDLDRCTADNVLVVLESIKTFFDVTNIKIVMAIDTVKVERAWELRYNSSVGKMEGREHTEKMFSLKLALPPKSREQLAAFVKHHAGSLDKADVDFILHNAQSNPRKIKHMLNLLYATLPNVEERGGSAQERDANFNSDLKMLIAWIALTLNHPDMARQIQREPLLLITAAIICRQLGNRGALLEFLEKIDKNEIRENQWRVHNLYVSSDMLKPDAYGLLRAIADEPPSFSIVSHVADQFNLEDGPLELNSMDGYEAFHDQLQSVIDSSGMIGA